MLAFLAACARDPLLRAATPFLFTIPLGHTVATEAIADHLHALYPSRFRPSTLIATALRLASSWTPEGYLQRKKAKRRTHPHVTPIVTAFALVLGYLCGRRGARLVESIWTQLLDCPAAELIELIVAASTQEWLRYKAAGTAERSDVSRLSAAEGTGGNAPARDRDGQDGGGGQRWGGVDARLRGLPPAGCPPHPSLSPGRRVCRAHRPGGDGGGWIMPGIRRGALRSGVGGSRGPTNRP
jgi:hypothetical protein